MSIAVAVASCVAIALSVVLGRNTLRSLVTPFVVAAACLGALHLVGADVEGALRHAPPLLLVVGYSAVAAVAYHSGELTHLGQRVGRSPVAILALAATLTVLTSNDTVILILAPIVLVGPRPWRAAAALYVGANVTGMLLPQGSPTNVMIQTAAGLELPGYVATTALPTAAMAFTAALAVRLLLRTAGSEPATSGRTVAAPGRAMAQHPRLSAGERQVLLGLAAAVGLQGLWWLVGGPTWALGVALVFAACMAAPHLGSTPTRVLHDTAWVVLPAATVMLAAGGVLAGSLLGSSRTSSTLAIFGISAVLTDLAGAGVAAGLVKEGILVPADGLVAVTSGAFATPVASLSGLLLWRWFRLSRTALDVRTFAVPTLVAGLALLAGTVTAHALPG